jgi:hypothetical protein
MPENGIWETVSPFPITVLVATKLPLPLRRDQWLLTDKLQISLFFVNLPVPFSTVVLMTVTIEL